MTTAGVTIFGIALVLVVGGNIAFIRLSRSRDDRPRVQRRVLAIVALGLAIGIAIALARTLG
jgi:uncharacterized membrane protein YidH (DUF202 family)